MFIEQCGAFILTLINAAGYKVMGQMEDQTLTTPAKFKAESDKYRAIKLLIRAQGIGVAAPFLDEGSEFQ